jgi:hypothetical protein
VRCLILCSDHYVFNLRIPFIKITMQTIDKLAVTKRCRRPSALFRYCVLFLWMEFSPGQVKRINLILWISIYGSPFYRYFLELFYPIIGRQINATSYNNCNRRCLILCSDHYVFNLRIPFIKITMQTIDKLAGISPGSLSLYICEPFNYLLTV